METRKDYISLTGTERVAVLLLAMPDEQVSKIFNLMDETEIREVVQTMANLGKVSSNVVEIMVTEFVEQISATGTLIGTFESTKRLLSKALPKEKVDSIMEEISGPAGRTMWDKLSNINEELLANYLRNEYPQTIAVVLTRIKADHASKVLALLPDPLAMEVILRMLKIENVRREILDDIERTLRTEFMNNITKTSRNDSYVLVAEVFNFFDRATEAKFITSLEEHNFEAAEKIKNLMFTFEDMIKLDSNSIQTVLRTADKTKLALVLKGASEGVRECFFSGMSERAGKIMIEDMQSMGMVRVRDVDEAQSYVVSMAKGLANSGEITIRMGAEAGDELIG